jgi:molybdopterin-containing oxidoreductase family iron-sulfur binding subunit
MNVKKNKTCKRREFLSTSLKALGGLAVIPGIAKGFDLDAFLQKNFRELSSAEIDKMILRMEKEYFKKYKKEIKVGVEPPPKGVSFAYALDLSRCIGCRRCVYACVKENNQSRSPQIQWIKVLKMEKEKGVDLRFADAYYEPDEVPEEGHFYMPVACHHCDNAPCVKVCPVQAPWKDRDGIVVIDYSWGIGCRYCMAACPYGARHFNWKEPGIPPEEINTNTHYMGNRPRYKGVVEKCTFCVQRVRNGKYPACVEICPTGSRKFGNLLDPESEIRYIIKNKRVFIFKEELNTQPKFFYFYGI